MDDEPHIVVLDSHYSHLYNIEFLELMKCNQIPLLFYVFIVNIGILQFVAIKVFFLLLY